MHTCPSHQPIHPPIHPPPIHMHPGHACWTCMHVQGAYGCMHVQGAYGVNPLDMHAWQELTPTAVSFIHKRGGTILGSSRGNRPDEHLDEIMVCAHGYECACMASLPMQPVCVCVCVCVCVYVCACMASVPMPRAVARSSLCPPRARMACYRSWRKHKTGCIQCTPLCGFLQCVHLHRIDGRLHFTSPCGSVQRTDAAARAWHDSLIRLGICI